MANCKVIVIPTNVSEGVYWLDMYTYWVSLMFTLLRWFGYDRLTESVSMDSAAALTTGAL